MPENNRTEAEYREAIVDLLGQIHPGDLLRRIYKFVEYLHLHH